MTVDGLAALTQQRERSRSARTTLPPRHTPRPPAAAGRLQPAQPTTEGPEATGADTSTPPAATPPADAPASTPKSVDAVVDDLVRSSIYVDAQSDAFLEDVRVSGRRGRPKVDASRSAVVRLALSRLAAEATPGEVVDMLRARATDPTRPGRPRR